MSRLAPFGLALCIVAVVGPPPVTVAVSPPIALRAQAPEGAMGIVGNPFEQPVAMSGQSPAFAATIRITKHNTFDFKGVQFYELTTSDGSATISVDADLPLARALERLAGGRARLTLYETTLQEITK